MSMDKFNMLFSRRNKPILGMIHLAGDGLKDVINKAINETIAYKEMDLAGIIVENYYTKDVKVFASAVEELSRFDSANFKVGLNFLGYDSEGMNLAERNGLAFVQQDAVAGRYLTNSSGNYNMIERARREHPEIFVFGGVWPKYYTPIGGSDFASDLIEGKKRADAIVITGEGTGMETPIEKILEARRVLGYFPAVVGAGLNIGNAYEQMRIADGAIVGSHFKIGGCPENDLDVERVRKFMDEMNRFK